MALKLSEVVSITGVPGLHKIVKADSKNVIIESLDETKKRQLVRGNMMVSKLSDISMYVENDESENLTKILQNIQAKYDKTLPVNPKSANGELMDFLESVLPNYDKIKVYPSNVKKLVQWYSVLILNEVSFEDEVEEEEVANEEVVAGEEVTSTEK